MVTINCFIDESYMAPQGEPLEPDAQLLQAVTGLEVKPISMQEYVEAQNR